MEQNTDITALVDIVRQEHRSTRLVFGASIIVLSLVLMIIAPAVIRSGSMSSLRTNADYTPEITGIPGAAAPEAMDDQPAAQEAAPVEASTTDAVTDTTDAR